MQNKTQNIVHSVPFVQKNVKYLKQKKTTKIKKRKLLTHKLAKRTKLSTIDKL